MVKQITHSSLLWPVPFFVGVNKSVSGETSLHISEDSGSRCAKEGCFRPFEPFHSEVCVACVINIDVKQAIYLFATVAKYLKIGNQIKISNLD